MIPVLSGESLVEERLEDCYWWWFCGSHSLREINGIRDGRAGTRALRGRGIRCKVWGNVHVLS